MTDERLTGNEPLSGVTPRPLSRRTFVRNAAMLGLTLPAASALLAACGGSGSDTDTTPTTSSERGSGGTSATATPSSEGTRTSATPAAPSGPQVIVIAQGLDPETLDPHATTVAASENIATLVVERLVEYDYEQEGLVGILAERWESVDELTWELTLRQGVTFTNGEPMNAEAAKFSLERIQTMPHATGRRFQAEGLAVEVVDDHTLQLKTAKPFPFMIFELCRVSVVPSKHVQEVGDQEYGLKPVGTGPFLFQEWVKGDHVTLVQNEDYWGEKPTLTKVTFRAIPEPSSRTAALQTGEADLITLVSLSDIPTIQNDPNLEVIAETSNRSMFVRFDTSDPRLQDPRVRQAFNYAVDKEAIVNDLLLGYGEVLNGQPIGRHILGHNPDLEPYPSDPDKAKQLLDEVGYDYNTPITLYTPVGRYMADKEITEAIAGMLEAVGVTVEVQALEWGVWISKYNDGTLTPMTFIGIHTAYPDAYSLLNLHVTGSLGGKYSNPEYDELVTQAGVTIDPEQRVELYHQAAKILRDDAALLFLHQQKDVYAINKRVQGWKPRPDEFISLKGVSIAG